MLNQAAHTNKICKFSTSFSLVPPPSILKVLLSYVSKEKLLSFSLLERCRNAVKRRGNALALQPNQARIVPLTTATHRQTGRETEAFGGRCDVKSAGMVRRVSALRSSYAGSAMHGADSLHVLLTD